MPFAERVKSRDHHKGQQNSEKGDGTEKYPGEGSSLVWNVVVDGSNS